MKKRIISKFYTFFFCILLGICILPISGIGATVFISVIGWIMLIQLIYGIFFVFPSGLFEISRDGISIYIGFKKYCHKWSDFSYVHFARVSASRLGGHVFAYTYWVCFSNSSFPPKDETILKQAYHRLHVEACFQYRSSMSNTLREILPEKLKAQFIMQEDELLSNMNRTERRYNK